MYPKPSSWEPLCCLRTIPDLWAFGSSWQTHIQPRCRNSLSQTRARATATRSRAASITAGCATDLPSLATTLQERFSLVQVSKVGPGHAVYKDDWAAGFLGPQ